MIFFGKCYFLPKKTVQYILYPTRSEKKIKTDRFSIPSSLIKLQIMFGKLVPVGGGDDIPLHKNELIVGRKEDCDVVLRFGNVSSRHCRLVLSNGYWYVQDMKSTNGIKVNGLRVDDRRIDPGAKLTVAHLTFIMEYDPQELGAFGAPPPDVLDTLIFEKSLLEKAGLAGRAKGGDPKKPDSQKTKTKSDDGVEKVDYSAFTVEDIKFN